LSVSPRDDQRADPSQRLFAEHWQPRTVGRFNGHDLMVVKAKGEFVWHKHDDTDDFFLVIRGRGTIEMRSHSVTLRPGDMFVVPRGRARDR
jgi:mannose-6-phosphate isomerase-like protein (cupin superfamily)